MLDRLSESLTDAGIPMERVEGVAGSPVLVFQAVATQQQRDDAAAIVAAFDWSEAAHAAWLAGKLKAADIALATSDPDTGLARVVRGLVAALVDEINALRQQTVGVATLSWDPANLANGSGATSPNITVNGAAFRDAVDVAAPYSLQGLVATGYVSAANTVVIRLHNGTGGAVNLASGVWGVAVRRPTNLPDRTLAQARAAIAAKINAGEVDL